MVAICVMKGRMDWQVSKRCELEACRILCVLSGASILFLKIFRYLLWLFPEDGYSVFQTTNLFHISYTAIFNQSKYGLSGIFGLQVGALKRVGVFFLRLRRPLS